jgi:predicted DNA-binding protein with PD1-like motif
VLRHGTARPEPDSALKEHVLHVIEVRDAELMESLTRQAKERGIVSGAIVSLIGAVDSFTVSTMPTADASEDIVTDYHQPAEMSGTGEISAGTIHIHAVMAVEGDRAIAGHLHRAQVSAWFARAYILETTG